MNTNRNKLALRKQSIRTLTRTELIVVHGGTSFAGPTLGSSGHCGRTGRA